ncbi:hypothetical protein [uncultured Thiodictyon sp.]|uniref:hypothetical protein n=1 Tax=uncultured Thiodictyon sp. TaxID=1846217 RepID=UPI0025E13DC9|nr:hypothetical protein [uncultured Thiodictyon sp.]
MTTAPDLEKRIDAVEITTALTREAIGRIGHEARGLIGRIESLEQGCSRRGVDFAVLQSEHGHSRELLHEIREQGRANAASIATIATHIEGLKSSWVRQMLAVAAAGITSVLGAIWIYITHK